MRWFFWLLPLFSSVLLATSLDYGTLGFLSLVGLIPFLVFLYKARSKKSAFLGGWLYGFVFFGLNLRWFFSTFSFNWAEVPGDISIVPVVGFVWFILSFGMGLSFGVFAVLVFKLSTGRISDFLFIPSAWVVCELIKSELFMLISWGPGGNLSPNWMMGDIGLSLVDTPFIFWSRLFGIYGMDFLIVFVNILIFYCFKNIRPNLTTAKSFTFLFFVLLLLLLFPQSLFLVDKDNSVFKVALLQANSRLGALSLEAISDLWENLKKTNEGFSQPDIVILPEGFEVSARQFFYDVNKDGIVISSTEEQRLNNVNPVKKIFYRNQAEELVDEQEKNFLIPAGEYLPLSVHIFIKLLGKSEVIKPFLESRVLSRGVIIEKPVVFKDTKIAVLLCSGVLSPSLYRDQTKNGAEILINSASLTIFNENPSFFHQIKNMARFQAIANARPFLQSANGGPAFYINENGKVVNEGDFPKTQFVLAGVAPVKTKTTFTRFGNWPLYLAVFFVILFFIRSRKSQSLDPK